MRQDLLDAYGKIDPSIPARLVAMEERERLHRVRMAEMEAAAERRLRWFKMACVVVWVVGAISTIAVLILR